MKQLLVHPKTNSDLDAVVAAPRACYMLVGERGSGKLTLALYVAEQLQVAIGDVLRIAPNDKNTITIEQAHDLIDNLSKYPIQPGGKRVVIIESAERMTIPAQNALLKVIEEPAVNTIFLLLISSTKGVLSTIKSRCQTIYVRPVVDMDISDKIKDLARGRAGLAMEMLNSSEVCDMQTDITSRAGDILRASSFDRILLVDKLASDKDQGEIIDWLAYKLSEAVRQQKAPSQALQSMQNYFIYSNAGVASKHALTEMMIRL